MDIEKVKNDILECQKVALTPSSSLETIIKAGVDASNIIADIQYELDLIYAEYVRKNPEESAAKIEQKFKSDEECIELRKMLAHAKSINSLLTKMEYFNLK